MNLLIFGHGSFFLDPCEVIFRFGHHFLAVPCFSLSHLTECEGQSQKAAWQQATCQQSGLVVGLPGRQTAPTCYTDVRM